ncbi:MAG: DUF4129 domain-containing protein [Planctomycetota bacterium]
MSSRPFPGLIRLVLLLGLMGSGLLAAPPQDPPPAGVREALTEGPQLPWYDPVEHVIREVPVPEHVEPPTPSDWQRELEPVNEPAVSNWNWDLDGLWTVLQWIVWILLAALAIFAVWLLIQAYLRGEMQGAVQTKQQQPEAVARADIQRLENLPVDLAVEKHDLLAAAKRLYEAAAYSDAMVCLFSYQLLELDRHHLLHLVKGKTNRQYLGELKERQPLRALMEQTMLAFEDTFFGNLPISAQRFEQCWSQVDRFHQLIGKQA